MTEGFLAGLKFLAILSTGLWGAIGLLVDYKRDGVVTVWGKRALVGTILSTFIAVATESIQTYNARVESERRDKQTQDSALQNERTLLEIRRAVFPLTEVSFGASISISKVPAQLESWFQRAQRYALKQQKYADEKGLVLIEDTAYMPHGKGEMNAHEFVTPQFNVLLFSSTERAKCYWSFQTYRQQRFEAAMRSLPMPPKQTVCVPDLALKAPRSDPAGISINPRSQRVEVMLLGIRATLESSAGGKIVSLVDLPNTVACFVLNYGDNDDLWSTEVRKRAELGIGQPVQVGAYRPKLSVLRTGEPNHVLCQQFADTLSGVLGK